MKRVNWWEEKSGFFGNFYMRGDNSKEGYLAEKFLSLSQRTKREVSGIIHLLHLGRGNRILDIPCGYGRHSVELSKRGLDVTGLDINAAHIDVAIKKSDKPGLAIDFRKENMLLINYDNFFDAVINMFFSFGFFETDVENFHVLKNFFHALNPGGKFLMHTDVNIPRIISGKYRLDEIRNLKSGGKLRIIENFNPANKRVEGRWIITDSNGNVEEKNYSVRVYEKDEFVEMCLLAGFNKCTAYSSWKGDPYSEDSEEIMFVAIK